MPLSKRVGRLRKHGESQCENLPNDQEAVILLLNLIPFRDGGMQGTLVAPILAGFASDNLYRAITRFEDQHFPGQENGFVAQGQAMFQRLEDLAARNAAAPWAAKVPSPKRVAPPSTPLFAGVLSARLTCYYAWSDYGFGGRTTLNRSLGTLTIRPALKAAPNGRGGYAVAEWIGSGGWFWQPSPGMYTALPPHDRIVRGKLRGDARSVSVPEALRIGNHGLFIWGWEKNGGEVKLFSALGSLVATLQLVPGAEHLLLLASRLSDYESNAGRFREIYEQTGAPDFAYPEVPKGHVALADPAEDEIQWFAWSFEHFVR